MLGKIWYFRLDIFTDKQYVLWNFCIDESVKTWLGKVFINRRLFSLLVREKHIMYQKQKKGMEDLFEFQWWSSFLSLYM